MALDIKIYLAAPWVEREAARAARTQLQDDGYTVTSRWLDVDEAGHQKDNPDDEPFYSAQAVNDLQDVARADVVVVLNLKTSEGKAVETGLAIAWTKPVIIIGEKSNIFHYLPGLPIVPTVGAASEMIRIWKDETEAVLANEAAKQSIVVPTDADIAMITKGA
jgi:nucleoside 2-deoxyribosyltransferase